MNHVISVANRVLTIPNSLKNALMSNSQGLETISFSTDAEWTGFHLVAVFQREYDSPVNVAVGTSNVNIPHEVLRPSGRVRFGLFGTKDELVMPTLWSAYCDMKVGTDTSGLDADEDTKPLYEQALAKMDSMAENVQTAIDTATGAATAVGQYNSRIGALETAMPTKASTSDLAAKANQSDLTALNLVVEGKADATSVAGDIEAIGEVIATKADQTDLTALQTTVNGKADSTTVSALATTVSGKAEA